MSTYTKANKKGGKGKKKVTKKAPVSLSAMMPKPPLAPGQESRTVLVPSTVVSPASMPSVRPKLLLLRGAPGSGKTTLARTMFDTWKHFCADDFFVDSDGKYNFNPKRLQDAHDWCFNNTKDALARGENVVVHNTFRTLGELNRYNPFVSIADVKIYRVVSQFTSEHNVPNYVMKKHLEEYEFCPAETEVKLNLDTKKIVFCRDGDYKNPKLSFTGEVGFVNDHKIRVNDRWFITDPTSDLDDDFHPNDLCERRQNVTVIYYQLPKGVDVVCAIEWSDL